MTSPQIAFTAPSLLPCRRLLSFRALSRPLSARTTRPLVARRCQVRMTSTGDDFPDGVHSPWASHLETAQSTLTSCAAPQFEGTGTAPPSIPADGGGFGGGRDEDDGHIELLRQFGRSGETLAPEIRALPKDAFAAYLQATKNWFVRWLTTFWPGWRLRVAADPEFPFKVLMELTVGVGLSASGMIAARGKDLIKELDFAICDVAVGAAVNFILVYLLTPVLGAGAGGWVSRLPANMFSQGNFGMMQRMGTLIYKGGLFGICGFVASVGGTAVSYGLVGVRRMAFGDTSEKKLPDIMANSLAWGGFMVISSNPRYQLVAGVERGMFAFLPDAAAKLGSGLLRTGNNIVGGATWVWWARAIGLQKKPSEDEKIEAAVE